jgi:hypothetical protein
VEVSRPGKSPATSDGVPAGAGEPSRVLAGLVGVFILAAVLLIWVDDALPYLEFSEMAYGRFWDRFGLLLAHLIGGSLALFIGPFQLWSGLVQRRMRLHRWAGRLYVAGVALAALSAFPLSLHTQSWTFGVALSVGGVIWIVTTAAAVLAVLQRKFVAHREWMVRSYIMTLAFVSFRLLLEVPAIERLGSEAEVSTTFGWLSWVGPLLAYEFIRQTRHDRLLQRMP